MLAVLVALGSALSSGPSPVAFHDPEAKVRIDNARKEVVVTVGPFHVAAMPPGMHHEDMAEMNDHNTPVIRFAWPVTGWLRGFSMEVTGADGKTIDPKVIHHLIGVNFDRRQLVYPAFERIFGIGQETGSALVPKSIGVPLKNGTKMGMYMAWQNETGKDLDDVTITLRLPFSPSNLNPKPVDALPIYMDVNLTVGGMDHYDSPAGHSEKTYEFTVPTSGRLLAFGGHLHDYGSMVRLEEVATGKTIAKVTAVRTAQGKVTGVSRSLPGVTGEGIKLKSGTRYRVVGVYDNPTGAPIKSVMAHMVGLFAPDDLSRWPAIDMTDKGTIADLADLNRLGKAAGGHEHHGM